MGRRSVLRVALLLAALPAGLLGWVSPASAADLEFTFHELGGVRATGMTVGPSGGDLWFASLRDGVVGRITTDGEVTTFLDDAITASDDLAVGADGALWFTNRGAGFPFVGNGIGRITTV